MAQVSFIRGRPIEVRRRLVSEDDRPGFSHDPRVDLHSIRERRKAVKEGDGTIEKIDQLVLRNAIAEERLVGRVEDEHVSELTVTESEVCPKKGSRELGGQHTL